MRRLGNAFCEQGAPFEHTSEMDPSTTDLTSQPPRVFNKVDLHCRTNNSAHHTSDIREDQLIVRRGQSFLLTLDLLRPFNPDSDTLTITAVTGSHPSEEHGTRSVFGIPESPETSPAAIAVWKAELYESSKLQTGSVTLAVTPPPDAPIGQYSLSVRTSQTKDAMEEVIPDATKECCLGTLVLLFNPWCSDDWVYLADEDERQEYVMNEQGVIFKGVRDFIWSLQWDYGQFEEEVVEICLKMLDVNLKHKKDPANDVSARCNPIYVSRVVSAMINSDDDSGVLVGSWDGKYGDGLPPSHWNGSVDILQRWHSCDCKSVMYGQCWVFAAVMCTVLRCLGIPCRVVTNYSSAYDDDNSLTIDVCYNEDGVTRLDSEDSIWNFHVWVEAWMRRPDLSEDGSYDGWQVVDPTPQQLSGGVYCCGPASVKAVYRGDIHLKYDVPFVFSEVNADRVEWLIKEGCPRVRISSDTKVVGKNISTKAVCSKKRLDITDHYKPKEGTEKERATFEKAMGSLIEMKEKEKEEKAEEEDEEVNANGATPNEATPRETSPGEATPNEATPREASPGEATPNEATPREASPGEATPNEATPREATPGEATPNEATPREATPGEATPNEAIPREATPGEATPNEATPREATPGEATPNEATPREATPGEATPNEAIPREATPGEATPNEAIPREAIPGEATPNEATPRQATPGEATPNEATPRQATPGEATPNEATPREATPGETTPNEAIPREATPGEATPNEATPPEATPGEATPNEATPREATPGEATPNEATPREATPGEATADGKTLNEVLVPKKVSMSFKEESEIVNGQDISLKLKMRTEDQTARPFSINISIQAMRYTGAPAVNIHTEHKEETLQPGQELSIPIVIPFSIYGKHLLDCDSLKVSAVATDKKDSENVYLAVADIVPQDPPISLTVLGPVQLNREVAVEVSFQNPISEILKECKLTISGSGLFRTHMELSLPDLKPDQLLREKVNFCPYKAGVKTLVVDFDCSVFRDIKGSCTVDVKPA